MLPDSTFFQDVLLNPDQWTLVNIVAVLGGLAAIIALIQGFWKSARRRRQVRQASKAFGLELYTEEAIENYSRYYIQPHCGSMDPGKEVEMRDTVETEQALFAVVDKFLAKNPRHKHLILLADSGMGKSSFMINYHLHNQRKKDHESHRIAIVPLGIPDPDSHIASIEQKNRTVIFLDALDEDTRAIEKYRDRLLDLMRQCYQYKRVLITCRTQFFLKDDEIPREPGTIQVGPTDLDESKSFEFKKLYLFPFDDQQIQGFLKKRYPFWKWFKRKQADKLIQKVPFLNVRPMLLTYIPDLLASGRKIDYSFQLYEVMIEKWLRREKPWVKPEVMRAASEELAIDLYCNRKKRGGEFIPYDELASLLQSKEALKVPLKKWQLTGRSLLNRDGVGNYKFSHRSIMEYLFIKQFFKGKAECRNIAWTDQMKMFFLEKLRHSLAEEQKVPAGLAGTDIVGMGKLLQKPLYQLRFKGQKLDWDVVKTMLQRYDFYESRINTNGQGALHFYELRKIEGDQVVVDHACGLMWEQSGSKKRMQFNDSKKYINDLNSKRFAGFRDWRLPILEEAMSLMEPKKHGKLYIDPVFDKMQDWIWTSDKKDASAAWVVYFNFGLCNASRVGYGSLSVRAVRSGQSS